MSLPMEDEIMREIGLGNHYSWFNGSGSCGGIRKAAARRLPDALRAHGIAPHMPLLRLLERVAEQEGQNGRDYQYVLTKTWQACSTVIRAHMDGDANRAQVREHVERAYLERDPHALSDPHGFWRDIKAAAHEAKVREMKSHG